MGNENSKRIAKNALALYIRMLFTMGASLYASRVVLKTLGVNDFGIYNVINSFVAMFSMMTATLTTSTQRFLSYELGKKQINKAADVFSVSLNIHILLSVVVVIMIESIGLWFLNAKMSIPAQRLHAANWVLQLSAAAFVVNLLSVPYNAAIIANEKMDVFAYIAILEVGLKLLSLVFLVKAHSDRLIAYSALILSVAVLIRIVYGICCRELFPECKYKRVKSKSVYKDILSVSGWNFLGSSASIATGEGIGLMLNLYGGGVIVNAAKGIANQVQNAIQQLVGNFMMSINPQITKSYAASNLSYMDSLVDRGSRLSFYLLALVAFPILLETNQLLSLWLNVVPPYATEFVRGVLLYLLLYPFSTLLDQVLMASGKIRNSQIVISIFQFLNLPVAYLVLISKLPPYCIYYGIIIISLMCLGWRIYFACQWTGTTGLAYIRGTMVRSFVTIGVAVVIPIIFVVIIPPSVARLIFTFILTMGSIAISGYVIGIDKQERTFFDEKIRHIVCKTKKI